MEIVTASSTTAMCWKFVVFVVCVVLFAVDVENVGVYGFECPGEFVLTTGGSSTLAPIALEWRDKYNDQCRETGSTVVIVPTTTANAHNNNDNSDDYDDGTSAAGAQLVCNTNNNNDGNNDNIVSVDIGNMDRNWRDTEAVRAFPDDDEFSYVYSCINDPSITVLQVEIAVQGIVVVTSTFDSNNNNNVGTSCIDALGGALTVDQLRWIFTSYTDDELLEQDGFDLATAVPNNNNNNVREWSDLDGSCPQVPIELVGPELITTAGDSSSSSTTAALFAKRILKGQNETFASSYQAYQDNSARLWQGIVSSDAVIAITSFAFYQDNSNSIKAAALLEKDSGTVVEPTRSTIANGTYKTLSRRLYMNIRQDKIATAGEFIRYGLSTASGLDDIRRAGYLPIPVEEIQPQLERIDDFCFSDDTKPVLFGVWGFPILTQQRTCNDVREVGGLFLNWLARRIACRPKRVGFICPTQCGLCE